MSKINEINVGDTFSANCVFRVVYKNEGKVRVEYEAGGHWLEGHLLRESEVLRHLELNEGRLVGHLISSDDAVAEAKRARKSTPKGALSELQQAVLKAIGAGTLSTSDIAKTIGKPSAAANSALSSLKAKGLVSVTETGAGLQWAAA